MICVSCLVLSILLVWSILGLVFLIVKYVTLSDITKNLVDERFILHKEIQSYKDRVFSLKKNYRSLMKKYKKNLKE